MKVTIVPIVIGAFGTVTKGLLKGPEDLVETIQMTALLRTAQILRRVLETYCLWNSSEKPSANTDVKNSKGVNNNNNNNNNVFVQFLWYQIILIQIICIHSIWFQVFRLNTNNFQTGLFDP